MTGSSTATFNGDRAAVWMRESQLWFGTRIVSSAGHVASAPGSGQTTPARLNPSLSHRGRA
ncbi:hypothetical protein [Streptomyces sp. NRRL S-340]|uniref:hypothetical protein n=1 Tax=Streptomyces sp. NRRL S-340 TaxID=1463901 RepID=UPI000563EAD7|nr:hypothetical protein [Streptomyces sp. NRRL S-340]